MVGGMCSMLPYGTGIYHYALNDIFLKFIFWGVHFFFFVIFKKCDTDKSDESARSSMPLPYVLFVVVYITRMIFGRLFL